jgi:PST family polysaccharide transporter
MKKDVSDKRQMFSQIRNSVIDTALQRLARNSGWLLAAEAVAAIVSVLQFPLVARLLGAEGYGKATLIVGWVGLLGSVLGIQTRKTIVKYLSLYLSNDQNFKALAIVKLGLILNISMATASCAIMYIIAPTLSLWILDSTDGVILFRIIILRDYFAATTGTTTSVLKVLDRFRWLSVVNALTSISTFLLVATVLLNNLEVIGYLTAVTAVSVIQSIILLLYSSHRLRLRCGGNWWKTDLGILQDHQNEIRTMLFSMKLDGLRKVATDKADVVILGIFVNIYSVGLYKMGKQLATYVSRLTNPIYSAIYPALANLYHESGGEYIPKFVGSITRWMIVAMVISITLLLSISGTLVPLAFGKEYIAALPIFYIIMLMHIWLTLIWAPGLMLTLGKARQLMSINLISAVVMIVSLFVLAPVWGTTGAAIALVTNYWVWSALILWYISRTPDIRLWAGRTQSKHT